MVMDSFKYEQRKLLSELSDKEIVITEVRDLEILMMLKLE